MATLNHLGTGLLFCRTKRHGCKFLLHVALAVAQDRVPAFSAAKAAEIVERDLGQPISKLFKRFDTRPIAAASLGQVGKRLCFELGARLFCHSLHATDAGGRYAGVAAACIHTSACC